MDFEITNWLFPKRTYRLLPVRDPANEALVRYDCCPVCGSNNVVASVEIGDSSWASGYRLSVCEECAHTFYQDVPPPEVIAGYYQDKWLRTSVPAEGKEIVGSKIADVLADIGGYPAECAILDIGCGGGALLAGLQRAGYEQICGIEPSETRYERATHRFPGRIHRGGFQDVAFDKKFDVIFSNHVLEHIHSPSEFMAWTVGNLNDDGVIILAVPNSQYESVMAQLLFMPHLHSFSISSLSRLGTAHGLACHLWHGGRFDELTCVFTRRRPECRFEVAEHFVAAEALGMPTPAELRNRLQAPWRLASNGAAIYMPYDLLNDDAMGAMPINELSPLQVRMLRLSHWLRSKRTVLGAQLLSGLVRRVMRRLSHSAVKGYLQIDCRGSGHAAVPRVRFFEGAAFVVK